MKPLRIIVLVTSAVLACVHGYASGQGRHLHLSYKVLDRYGQCVPNAKITLAAVTEEGKPHGPDATWSTGVGTDLNGLGHMGFGESPKPRPGKLVVIARHPSIEEVRHTVEWSSVLHDVVPPKAHGRQRIILKSKGGLGVAKWREQAASKAPALIERLMKAKDDGEVERLTKKIAAGEMCSIPALVAALRDYENPRRGRLIKAYMAAWHGCWGRGPLDPAIRKQALAIYCVHSFRGILAMKPREKPNFIRPGGKECLQEVVWVIGDLRRQIAAARKSDDKREIQAAEHVLGRMKEVEKQLRQGGAAKQ